MREGKGTPSVLAFEDFELDELRFELRHRGQPVRVQPKVLRLLLYLAQHRERCVAAQELLDALWPAERVTTASIKRAIGGARRALGEDASSQASIRTVRGRGYQFVRAVSVRLEAHEPSAAASKPQASAFFGREPVLRQLAQDIAAAREGHGRLIWVSGEPGIGKTRLLAELAALAARENIPAWFGRCTLAEGAPALWPFVQMLRAAALELPAEQVLRAMGSGSVDIAAAIPELRRTYPEIACPQAIDSTAARFRFFDSLSCFLQRVAEPTGLCLLFDDLQHADALTLAALSFLTEQLDRSHVLVVGTFRSGAASAAPGGEAEPWARLLRLPAAHEISLAGLSPNELASWLDSRFGSRPAPQLVARLHEQTAGNPLFVERVLLTFGEHSPQSLHNALRQRLAPERVQRAIEQHLARLTDAVRDCLQVAAVFGSEFTLGSLAQVLDEPPAAVAQSLLAAADAGLVRVPEAHVGSYAFAHGLIRTALYEQLGLKRRAQLHAMAARALEARSVGNELQVAQIADHYLRAAPAHDAGRALPAARRAAEAALQRAAFEEAAALFERALAAIELGSPEPRTQLELLLSWGDALARAGDASAARAALLDAAARARELGAHELVVRAAMVFAQQPETGSLDPARVALIEAALQCLPADDPRFSCLQALHAKALTYCRDRAGCTRIARKALVAARGLSDPALRTSALTACWHALAEPDSLVERKQIVHELARVGHEHHEPRALLWSAVARVGCAMEVGDLADVDAAIASIASLAEQLREPYFRWHALTFQAMRATLAGRLSDAEHWVEAALETGGRLGAAGARHVYCAQLSAIRRLQGRIEDTERLVREVSLAHPSVAGWQAALATIEAEQGLTDQPRAVLARLVERDLAALRCDPFALSAIAPTADLCLLVGDATLARPIYQALKPYATRHGSVSIGIGSHGPLARHLGRLALQMHECDLAERHFAEALALSEAMPSPLFISLSLVGYAHMLLVARPNAAERANAMIGRAARIAEAHELGAVLAYTDGLASLARGRPSIAVSAGSRS